MEKKRKKKLYRDTHTWKKCQIIKRRGALCTVRYTDGTVSMVDINISLLMEIEQGGAIDTEEK